MRRISSALIVGLVSMVGLLPLLFLILLSLKGRVDAVSSSFLFHPTLKNYIHAFDVEFAAPALANSMIISVLSSGFGAALAIPSAFWFSRATLRAREGMLFSVVAVRMLPPIGILVPIYLWFRYLGLLDSRLGLVLILTATNTVFSTWMLKGFFDLVPTQFEESAQMDGASLLRALWDVVLPTILPGLLMTVFFTFVASWNEFLFALTLAPYNARTLSVIIPSLVTPQGTQWGELAALSVISTAPIVGVALIAKNYFSRYLLATAARL